MRYNIVLTDTYDYQNQFVIVRSNKAEITSLCIDKDGNGDFTTLKECTEYIKKNNILNTKVYVKKGVYNLVEEFGQSYLDGIQQTSNKGIGLFIGNNTYFEFENGAKIEFIYNGGSLSTAEYFSPFNVYGSFTLENADIEVTNARYCVHEDVPTSLDVIPESYTAKYINCTMKHNGNNVGSYKGTICIGAGTNKNSLSVIDGGKYECGTQFPYAISYHNFITADYGDCKSKIVLKNVWVNNSIRLGEFGDSIVDVEISNCYLPNGYTQNTTHFNITAWGNVSQ